VAFTACHPQLVRTLKLRLWYLYSAVLLLGQISTLLNLCSSYRHSHPSTDFPAKDKGVRIPASSDRHVIRIIIRSRRLLRNDIFQGFAPCCSFHNLARCMSSSPFSYSTLTSICLLDPWPDHPLLALHPVCGWRRECLVWWRLIWGRSESQAGVEVSQAFGLHPIGSPPDYHLPRRYSDNIHTSTQFLRYSCHRLHSGAHFHPHFHLLSRQVHYLFSRNASSVL
jgi:hypothetical protein